MEVKIKKLPEYMKNEILKGRIKFLEWKLSETNPYLENDLNLSLMKKLAKLYFKLNRMPNCCFIVLSKL